MRSPAPERRIESMAPRGQVPPGRERARRAAAALALLLGLLAPAGRATAEPALTARVRSIFEAQDRLPGLRLRRLELEETRATIGVELPASVPLEDLPAAFEERLETAIGALDSARPGLRRFDLLVAHPGRPLAPPPRSARRAGAAPRPRRAIVPDPARHPFGQALAGRTIAISPGHGWIYYDNLGRFSTQRGRVRWDGCGTCRGIVEDFETHEIVVDYLLPLLEGAGARVILVRERDHAAFGGIVDDADPGYSEPGGTFTAGTSEGGHGAGYRVSDDPAAVAEWTIEAPGGGRQILSTWFVAGANRQERARLVVTAGGVEHPLWIDLTRHGRRWAPVLELDLDPRDPVRLRLEAPPGGPADRFVIADAIRLGAGMHESGHPWWEMGAQPFAAYQAAPADVRSRGDVTARPRYAEFYGADVYVALHSNASGQPDSTAAGSSTYRFNCGQYPDHSTDPAASACDDPTGSDRLQELVHGRMVEALRADWDPAWRDRGTRVANFGELRELDGIPGVLIESAFHDNVRLAAGSDLRVTDNQALHDPRVRHAMAWGIYRGLSEYFGGASVPLLAPPPERLVARRVAADAIELGFESVPGAQAYRVYVASGGRSFDAGRSFERSPARLEGLSPETIVQLRVASMNAAGEGLPSRTIAARPSNRPAQLLVVDAYARADAWVERRDNRGDTAAVHGRALAGVAHAFDGATEAAWAASDVSLAGYDGVVLALGRESTGDGVLTPALRAQVSAHAAQGGAVFAGGSEIAWALGARGDDADRAWLAEVFGAAYGADDAGATELRAAMGGWLGAVLTDPLALDDGTGGGVEAFFSDVLVATSSGTVELGYGTGTEAAAVRRDGRLLLGVALDSVVGEAARQSLLSTWAGRAVPLAPPVDIPDAGLPPDAGFEPDAGAPPDAGERPDTGPVDAGLAPDADAPPADAGAALPDAGLRLGRPADGRPPITGGCASTGGDGGVASLLVLALAAARRRRGRPR
jgi:MYXO-CTERM domain-containing protein